MRNYNWLKGIVVTEKSTKLQDTTGRVTLQVDLKLTKLEIRKAAQALFAVKVVSVNCLITQAAKRKLRNGQYKEGKRVKKAIIRFAGPIDLESILGGQQ